MEERYIDVDGCSACGKSHRGIALYSSDNPAEMSSFDCPDTAKKVYVSDTNTESVRKSEVTDELTAEQRARTRQVHYRSDKEALGVSGGDDARASDVSDDPHDKEADDDDTDLSEDDIRQSLAGFSAEQRLALYGILCEEFVTKAPDEPQVVQDTSVSPINSYQIGGEHYGLKKFQHWDIVAMFNLDYFQGQVTKYVMRWRDKNGIEDLEKGAHYLAKYIAVEKDKLEKSRAAPDHTDLMISPEAIDAIDDFDLLDACDAQDDAS